MSLWTGLCGCGHAIYNGNQSCSACMGLQAQTRRKGERKEQKQAQVLVKQRERAKGSKVAIKPVSKKQSAEQAELMRIKKELTELDPACFSCEESLGTTLSHIISRKHKQFVTDKRNLVLLCMECHHIYEHNKGLFSVMFPDKWRKKLLRAWELDKTEFYKLADKAE